MRTDQTPWQIVEKKTPVTSNKQNKQSKQKQCPSSSQYSRISGVPPAHQCGGFSARNLMILVVTITGTGAHPMYMNQK